MKPLTAILFTLLLCLSCRNTRNDLQQYEGKFCSGSGDINYLRLIDESFAFLNPNPVVPNLSMIYQPEWNTFVRVLAGMPGGYRTVTVSPIQQLRS